MRPNELGPYMFRGMFLASFLISLLMLGVASSLAIDSYSASYLIQLYEKSRGELLTIIGSSVASTPEGTSSENETVDNQTATSTSTVSLTTNATTSSNTSTTYGKCSGAQERIMEIIGIADSYIEQAKTLLSSGDYKEAAKLALKALNTLGRAWVLVGQCYGSFVVEANLIANTTTNTTTNVTVPTNTSSNVTFTNLTLNMTVNASRVAPGLLVAILRHELRLARLNAVIARAENASLNVSDAKNLTEQVAALLEEARAQALAGNTSAAAQLMAKANNLMAQIVKLLKTSSTQAIKSGKLEEIRERVREKLREREMNITATKNVMPPGLEKKEAWKEEKGKPGVPPGLEKKDKDKGKPENPGKGKGKKD